MKKSRKPPLVAAAVFVVVAALVASASALAAVWKHEGKTLTEKVELSLSGGEVIEVGSSALLCDSTATLATEGGSSGSITAFAVEKGSCFGLSGSFEGCTVTAATPKTLPYSVTVNSEDLTVKGFGITYTFSGCAVSTLETSYPELTLTPEEPNAIRFFHFGQTATGKLDGSSVSVTDGGAWSVPEADSGKYGIG
jgi:hypothetical protein